MEVSVEVASMTRAQLLVEREQHLRDLAESRKDLTESMSRIQHLEAENQDLEYKINWFKEQFRLARHRQFGSSSENASALSQTELVFNESEATLDSASEVVEPQTVTYTRKPKSVVGGRR